MKRAVMLSGVSHALAEAGDGVAVGSKRVEFSLCSLRSTEWLDTRMSVSAPFVSKGHSLVPKVCGSIGARVLWVPGRPT